MCPLLKEYKKERKIIDKTVSIWGLQPLKMCLVSMGNTLGLTNQNAASDKSTLPFWQILQTFYFVRLGFWKINTQLLTNQSLTFQSKVLTDQCADSDKSSFPFRQIQLKSMTNPHEASGISISGLWQKYTILHWPILRLSNLHTPSFKATHSFKQIHI